MTTMFSKKSNNLSISSKLRKYISITLYVAVTILLTSCNTKERVYENEHLKLIIPDNWKTVIENDKDKSIWLTISLIPLDEKYFSDDSNLSYIQNLIILAVDSDEMSQKEGWAEFDDYILKNYERTKQRTKVSPKTSIMFNGKKCWYWEVIASKNDKTYLQKKYSYQLGKFYISIISTQILGAVAPDIDSIIKSIKNKHS